MSTASTCYHNMEDPDSVYENTKFSGKANQLQASRYRSNKVDYDYLDHSISKSAGGKTARPTSSPIKPAGSKTARPTSPPIKPSAFVSRLPSIVDEKARDSKDSGYASNQASLKRNGNDEYQNWERNDNKPKAAPRYGPKTPTSGRMQEIQPFKTAKPPNILQKPIQKEVQVSSEGGNFSLGENIHIMLPEYHGKDNKDRFLAVTESTNAPNLSQDLTWTQLTKIYNVSLNEVTFEDEVVIKIHLIRQPSTGSADVRLFSKSNDNQAAVWKDYPAEDDENDADISWMIRKDYCYIITQRLGQFVVAELQSSIDVYEDVNQNNNNNGDDGDDGDEYELTYLGPNNNRPDTVLVFLILKKTSATGYIAQVVFRSEEDKDNYPQKDELESQQSMMVQGHIPVQYSTGPIHVKLTPLSSQFKLVTGNSLEMDILTNNERYFGVDSLNNQNPPDLDVTISLYAPGSTNIFSQCLPCFGSGGSQGTLITQLTGRLINGQRYVDAPSNPVQESNQSGYTYIQGDTVDALLADDQSHASQEYGYEQMQQAPNTKSCDVMSSENPSADVICEIQQKQQQHQQQQPLQQEQQPQQQQQHMLPLEDSLYNNLPIFSSDIILESIKTNLLPGLGEMSLSAFSEVVCKADPEITFRRNITPKKLYMILKMSCKNDTFDVMPIMQYLRNLHSALGDVGETQSTDCLEFLLQKEQLRRNQAEVCRTLRLNNIIPKLEAYQVISRDDRAILIRMENDDERSQHLIQEIVLKSDRNKFCDFIEAVNDTGQCHIVKMFSLDSICRGF